MFKVRTPLVAEKTAGDGLREMSFLALENRYGRLPRSASPATSEAEGEFMDKLKSNQWRLVTDAGNYVQPAVGRWGSPHLGPRETAELFDGRDNEEIKTAFYSSILGVAVHVEVESCAS